jgi:hypothetical protein
VPSQVHVIAPPESPKPTLRRHDRVRYRRKGRQQRGVLDRRVLASG